MTDSFLSGLPETAFGCVWLWGAGPGDPGLLALHALKALRRADMIVYDTLVDDRALDWTQPAAEKVHAAKRGGKPSAKQRDISLWPIALPRRQPRPSAQRPRSNHVRPRQRRGRAPVQNGIPIRIIPGISAGIGALAYARVPVTHRDVTRSVTFVTGHDQSGTTPSALDWDGMAMGSRVIVIYRSMEHIARIAAAGLSPPAAICIGRAVLMHQVLAWQAMAAGQAPRDLDPLGCGRPAEAG